MPDLTSADPIRGADYRMALPALGACAAAALATEARPRVTGVAALCLTILALVLARRAHRALTIAVVIIAGVCLMSAVRVGSVSSGPVAQAGRDRAVADVLMTLTSDPRIISTPRGDLVVVRVSIEQVDVRGHRSRTHAPVLVWADTAWKSFELGTTVRAVGRLGPADDSDTSATFDPSELVERRDSRAWWWVASARLRAGVSESVSWWSADTRALIPALVHGDESALSEQLRQDFRDSGLTHLLAVSGTNLTLVVGFLLAMTRLLGVHGRLQIVVGVVGTAAFVILARPEPSVVRAAAMGLVAIAGLGAGGRGRGMRCLAWAVIGLMLLDPWLARSVGFILSAVATAGILILGPLWRDALAHWMPRWCAEALAVPMAAQLVCTPVVAAISGQVSLVAVLANLIAAPAVGPATVLGLLGGGTALVSSNLSHLVGLVTGLFGQWIVLVGTKCAALTGAAYEWGDSAKAVALLVLVCLAIALCARPMLRRAWAFGLLAAVTAVVLVHPVSIGWPPAGWVMVACDVGQGDATVLNAGHGQAVVIDAGPAPDLADDCLRRLSIDAVPLIVLTHGHADHVDGLAGIVRDRRVGQIAVGPSGGPAAEGVDRRTVVPDERQSVGQVAWTVLAPDPAKTSTSADADDGESSATNNASVVMLAEIRGARILLAGDIEPEAQEAVMRTWPRLRADVLKVPHHGSSRQMPELFDELGASYATLSAGEGNSYGHPSPKTLGLLKQMGVRALRTDTQGDLALVVRDGKLTAVTR